MKLLLACALVCGLLAIPALALPAPTGLTANIVGDDLVLNWDDVGGAAKYSVDLELLVDVDGITEPVAVDLSYGTSDRTDGGEIYESYLNIDIDDLIDDIAAALGVDPSDIDEVNGTAKVKALDPGRGKGRQNNPFSDPVAIPTISD